MFRTRDAASFALHTICLGLWDGASRSHRRNPRNTRCQRPPFHLIEHGLGIFSLMYLLDIDSIPVAAHLFSTEDQCYSLEP